MLRATRLLPSGQISNLCPSESPALSSLSMNGAASITLYDPKRSSPHSPGPEGLILGTPPLPFHEGPLTPASSSSSRRVSGVNLEAIWEAMSAWTCGASQRQGRLRAVGPTPGPAPIPFRGPSPPPSSRLLPLFCFSQNRFPFPGTGWLSLPLPAPSLPPGPGLRPSVPSWGSCFIQTMKPEAGGGGEVQSGLSKRGGGGGGRSL